MHTKKHLVETFVRYGVTAGDADHNVGDILCDIECSVYSSGGVTHSLWVTVSNVDNGAVLYQRVRSSTQSYGRSVLLSEAERDLKYLIHAVERDFYMLLKHVNHCPAGRRLRYEIMNR